MIEQFDTRFITYQQFIYFLNKAKQKKPRYFSIPGQTLTHLMIFHALLIFYSLMSKKHATIAKG